MRHYSRAFTFALTAALASAAAACALAAEPPADPAKVSLSATPEFVAPGGKLTVDLRLAPQSGIKINRHPKMSLTVAEQAGVVRAAQVTVGNDAPPPPDRLDENYYKDVDPLRLEIELDPAIPSGRHEIPAKLRYYYCVAASGYCAPKRADIRIPITVR